MNCVTELPTGYEPVFHVDMQKDKKMAWLINGMAAGILVAMLLLGLLFRPLTWDDFALNKIFTMLAGFVAYLFLHELTHGLSMQYFGSKTVKYGMTSLYAYAGSQDYFGKKPYLFISLAPIVIWGVVLLMLNILVDPGWFWVVYYIQICNISGAAGDLYVTWKFGKMADDILVQDSGVAMTVYAKQNS